MKKTVKGVALVLESQRDAEATCPEAAHELDREGSLPLHWAAALEITACVFRHKDFIRAAVGGLNTSNDSGNYRPLTSLPLTPLWVCMISFLHTSNTSIFDYHVTIGVQETKKRMMCAHK